MRVLANYVAQKQAKQLEYNTLNNDMWEASGKPIISMKAA